MKKAITTRARSALQKSPSAAAYKTLTPGSGVDGAGAGAAAESRHAMIEEAAYYCAQRHGFNGCSELDDWLQAEAEVDSRLRRPVHGGDG